MHLIRDLPCDTLDAWLRLVALAEQEALVGRGAERLDGELEISEIKSFFFCGKMKKG